jgi:protein O-GlcNAc transferase
MGNDAALGQAIKLHQSGRPAEAEEIYRRVLASRPDDADALVCLGLLRHQQGRLDEAMELTRKAVALRPQAAEFQIDLAAVLVSSDRHEEAVAVCRGALALKPELAEGYHNLGTALSRLGRPDQAVAAFRQALHYKPAFAEARNGLGAVLLDMKRPQDAAAEFQQALAQKPQFADAMNNLGNALSALGRHADALIAFAKARDLQPDNPHIWYNAGNALKDMGRLEPAIDAYGHALALKPDYFDACNSLGAMLGRAGRPEQAVQVLRKARELKPNDARVHNNLGNVLQDMGYLEEAMESLDRAIALDPNYASSRNNMAIALMAMGRQDESLESYRRAVAIDPKDDIVHGNYIFCLHYLHGNDGAIPLAEARRWDARHGEPLRMNLVPHSNSRDPDRRLRVGYVSCDFRDHSVSRFLLGLLENHNHEQCEIICYSDVSSPDAATQRLRACADTWHDIVGVSDERVAEAIRGHGIDILVDLVGHSAGNRLPALARKPAPVQITYLGFPGTTGLATMDYRLTDSLADPPGMTEANYTEELLRLPATAWCFTPPPEVPEVPESPAADGRPICFGSFNKLNKLTPQTRELWAAVLKALPDSRLLIKDRALQDPATGRWLSRQFAGLGINPERLQWVDRKTDLAAHFQTYGQVDIALDSFPYHGATTTCEALWMGVPVVTLAGCTHVSRVGVSLLTNIGLPELIAQRPEDFVLIAAGLASDRARLKELRSSMRRRMLSSPLMDGPRLARDVESAYRQAWRRWCKGARLEGINV